MRAPETPALQFRLAPAVGRRSRSSFLQAQAPTGGPHRGARARCPRMRRRAFCTGRPHGGCAAALGIARWLIRPAPSLAAVAHPNPAFKRTALAGRCFTGAGAGRRLTQRWAAGLPPTNATHQRMRASEVHAFRLLLASATRRRAKSSFLQAQAPAGGSHRGARVRCPRMRGNAFCMGRPHGGCAGALGNARWLIGAAPSLAAVAHPNPAFKRTAPARRFSSRLRAGRRLTQR